MPVVEEVLSLLQEANITITPNIAGIINLLMYGENKHWFSFDMK